MKLSLNNGSSSGVTIISNIFIDHYMPQANGEFVKIYLYLLRCLKSENKELDLTQVADVFSCTESDILRTLRYWETKCLVVLSGTTEVTSIDFLEPMLPEELAHANKLSREAHTLAPAKKEKKVKKVASNSLTEAAPTRESSTNNISKGNSSSENSFSGNFSNENSSNGNSSNGNSSNKNSFNRNSFNGNSFDESSSNTHNAASPQEPPAPPTGERLRELKEMDEVRQMLFIAEQYMGTTLSRSAVDELLYIYDTLHFSVDLIDYLIEYCVSKGSSSIHYIKKVALSWHENGIDSVSKAKQETTTFHRNYFTILKALGVSNRNPLPTEVNTFNHWINDYGFTMDIITEACTRTITQTGKVNHKYTTKILNDWHNKGVRHLTDIQALDTLHRQLQADRAEQQNNKRQTNNSGYNNNYNRNNSNNGSINSANNKNNFNNFKQRNYDFAALEKQLLNQ